VSIFHDFHAETGTRQRQLTMPSARPVEIYYFFRVLSLHLPTKKSRKKKKMNGFFIFQWSPLLDAPHRAAGLGFTAGNGPDLATRTSFFPIENYLISFDSKRISTQHPFVHLFY
jgi:hypothetical protein